MQVLAYVREMFEERTMDGLRLEHCANEEAWKMYDIVCVGVGARACLTCRW